MYSTSLYEDIILSIASAPEISKFRDVVKASVLSLTIACFWPSSNSKRKKRFLLKHSSENYLYKLNYD